MSYASQKLVNLQRLSLAYEKAEVNAKFLEHCIMYYF